MTKHQEIALYANFVNGLPDGYLRDILQDSVGEIEQHILSDVATPGTIAALISARINEAQLLRDTTRELEIKRRELKEATAAMDRLTDEAKDTASAIELLARQLRQSV